MQFQAIYHCRQDISDASDDVEENLVELERFDDAVALGIKNSEQALNDVLESIVHL